ncbi:MAG: hypothetical protein JJE03_02995 [Peptostreptococcaceae bacterium]|nr:hypothetical protein [Peptostreptococcaceae bacterium]
MKLVQVMFTIFTNMPDLNNSTATVKRLLRVFDDDEVMFNSLQLLNVIDNTANVIDRPQVINQKSKWRIEFLPERINFVQEFDKETNFSNNLIEEKSKIAFKYMKNLCEEFGFKGSRFAFNSNYIVEKDKNIESSNFIVCNSKDDMKLHEWNTRKTFRQPIKLLQIDEVLNVIEEVSLLKNNQIVINGKQIKLDGLLVHYDINTLFYKKGERLKIDEFEVFLENACSIEVEKIKYFKEELA